MILPRGLHHILGLQRLDRLVHPSLKCLLVGKWGIGQLERQARRLVLTLLGQGHLVCLQE